MKRYSDGYNTGLIYTDEKKCIDCNKCIHECPVLTANVSALGRDDKYKMCVDEHECILCGTCIDTCIHDVRHYKDDFDDFLSTLKQGESISVLVAPAFYLNYPEYKNVFGYLKSLGVKNFYPVSFGADIAIWGYLKLLSKNNDKSMITQPCPCVVSHIEKHNPEMIKNLMPIQSPMMCTAIYLKRYLGVKEKLVFLSPCIAKKIEMQSKRGLGLISHNVTFKNLMDYIWRQGVKLDDFSSDEDELEAGMGSLFSQPGGLSENLRYYLGPEASIIQVEGENKVYRYLETLDERENMWRHETLMVDAINCSQGCNFGTGVDAKYIDYDSVALETIAVRKQKYYAMKEENKAVLLSPADRRAQLNEKFKDLSLEDFMCEYENNHSYKPISDEKIEAIFSVKLKKLTENDQHIDCSACGYKTCWQMAKAIALGINHHDNCVYYVKSTLAKHAENMSNAEERLSAMINNLPIVANLRNKDMKIVDCNEKALELYGFKSKKEYSTRFSEILPKFQPDGSLSDEKMKSFFKLALETGHAKFELTYESLQGDTIPSEVVFSRILWRGEYHVAGFIRDLREHYKNLEAIRLIEQRQKTIIDAAPMLCVVFDKDANVIDANEEAVRLLKLSNRQKFIDNFKNMLPERQPCGMLSTEKAALVIGKAYELGRNYIAEWVYRASDGEEISTEAFLESVMLGDKKIVLTYARDLRPVKAAIKLTLEANEMFKTFLKASPMLIEVYDDKFNLIDCNDQIARYFGLSSTAEYLERSSEFLPPFQPSGISSLDMKEIMLNEVFNLGHVRCEYTYISSSGELMPTEAHFARAHRQGKTIAICYLHDLRSIKETMTKLQNEEIRRERIEAESKSKTRFLAQVSHELRTPLNAIFGVAELALMREDISAENKESFQRITKSSKLLLSLINDILDLSKVAAGKLEIAPESYDSIDLIADTVQLQTMYLRETNKKIEFKLELDENLPRRMIGDELRIKQIMNNILSNAFKYSRKGTVTLSIGVEDIKDDVRVMLVIKISDTGVGMTDEQLKSLFDEFSRFEQESKEKIEGVGLGMPITYMLTTLMQGNLEVESEPGEGTTFTVSIPQKQEGPEVLGKATAIKMQDPHKLQQYSKSADTLIREPMPYGKVLVVDDVESNLHVAKGFLSAYRLVVDTAESGYEAIDKIDAGEVYDIVFMDHMMPGLNGVKATKIIQDKGYDRPIIALTANAVVGQEEYFIKMGFDGFISKPIVLKQLDDCLIRLIRDKQPVEIIEAARKEYDIIVVNEGTDQRLLMSSFLRDAKKVIRLLEPLVSLSQGDVLDDTALEIYTAHVHGMKTALSNIGNEKLSEVAFALEKAGLEADMATIKTITPSFLDDLRDVAEELETKSNQDFNDDEEQDADFVHKQLLLICQACESFDIAEAEDALAVLRSEACSKQVRKLLDDIEGCLLRGDFEEVTSLVEQYEKKT